MMMPIFGAVLGHSAFAIRTPRPELAVSENVDSALPAEAANPGREKTSKVGGPRRAVRVGAVSLSSAPMKEALPSGEMKEAAN
jgi:hypothetical protein